MCEIAYTIYSVEAVANYILNYARKTGIGDVTNLKMQKLVYFAQGFALARLKHPLFDSPIEAWTYGPVIPVLYKQLKKYGASPISNYLESPDVIPREGPAKMILDEVMRRLGRLTPPALVELTHDEGSPWAATWLNGVGCGRQIMLWQMVFYFQELLGEGAVSAS